VTTISQLDRKYYSDYVGASCRLDRTIRRYLQPQHRVLDLGAGPGHRFVYDYKAWTRQVVGVDRSSAVKDNPNLDAACIGDVAHLPFREGAFDLIIARFVFEHLRDPADSFSELRRVLRRGGRVVFHTPNRFHYYAVAARVTPHRFHVWFNRTRGWQERDVHETFFHANDRFTLRRLASRTGFTVEHLSLFEIKPGYLVFHPCAYRLGIAYERLVSRIEWLQDFRCNIIGVLEAS
jgi:SAM-dependent methyltransferase